jgi:acetoin utilization deacetylase AcuC-like enzyme
MKTIYSPAHLAHAPAFEFERGRMEPAVEIPERAERVRAEIEARKLGPIVAPIEFGNEPLLRVHDAGFVGFLTEAHAQWAKRYGTGAGVDAYPSAWPARGLREIRHGDIEVRLGTYAFDTATPITKGTWAAASAGANIALSAARAIREGERSVFALSRPPGHHASADIFGGYCYLNNVAIAAQWLRDAGMRPAILDVDYHHGNGTQDIFYRRNDVYFVSIHADPEFAYPHYSGFADERGQGKGEGFNLNLPQPNGTDWSTYAQSLAAALDAIAGFGPDVLLVSLGLDTFEHDPICSLKLTTEDYLRMGARIAKLGKPTLFVFEGGYHVEALGRNTANVLEGFVAG